MQYVCGQMSRAAQKRNPGRGSQRLHRALGGTRILLAAAPTAPPCFCRWQRSSLLHRGFPPPDYSAGRCCSNPPLQPLFKADKTETPVPGSDTGVLGGRGWIRTTEAEKQQIYSLSPLATREHAHILFAVIADCLYILSSEVAFVNYFFHGFSLFLSFSIFLRFTAIKALPIIVKDPKTFSVLRSLWSW